MKLKGKTILVTGVAGMIGSHLLDRLLDDTDATLIIGVDDLTVGKRDNIAAHLGNPRFRFDRGSVLDDRLLQTLPPAHVVVHLAAMKKMGETEPCVENLHVNGIGSDNVFRYALRHGSKVVFGSTSDCYGMSPDLPLREEGDLVLGPSMIKRWSYAVGKLYAEQLAFGYHKDYGLPVVILRYFGGFSERASFTWSSGHIPLFIDAVLQDRECLIHGDGSQTRSMSHVDNLVHGTMLAIASDSAVGEIVNLGDDTEMSVLDAARLIHRLSDSPFPLKLKFIPMTEIFGKYKDIQRRSPDLTKAVSLLGYEKNVSFEDGLRRVMTARRSYLGMKE